MLLPAAVVAAAESDQDVIWRPGADRVREGGERRVVADLAANRRVPCQRLDVTENSGQALVGLEAGVVRVRGQPGQPADYRQWRHYDDFRCSLDQGKDERRELLDIRSHLAGRDQQSGSGVAHDGILTSRHQEGSADTSPDHK